MVADMQLARSLLCTALAGAAVLPCALGQFTPMQPGAKDEIRYGAEVSYAARSDVALGSRELGEIDTLAYRVSFTPAFRVSEDYFWYAGIDFQNLRFDVPDQAPLPESLYGVSLRLGNQWQFAPKWTLHLQVSPGLYSDLEDISWGDFNLPGLAVFEYAPNRDLQWFFGAHVNVRRDAPVIPAVGARWRFSEDWTLLLVYPVPRIEYRLSDQWTLHAGVELIRSAYRVGEDFGDGVGEPVLNNEEVSYNDWRVGAGARWRLLPNLTLGLESGWMVDRRFHFDEEEMLVNGDGAPFVRLGLNGTF